MLRYYTKDLPNVAPTKLKIMKLANIGKVAFNINCITIHSTLVIPLNKIFNELKTLNNEKRDTLINVYDQLWLFVIDEISLFGNRILTFVDHKLQTIK